MDYNLQLIIEAAIVGISVMIMGTIVKLILVPVY